MPSVGEYVGKVSSRGPWVETYSGIYVNPLDLREDDIKIRDIAHSLSMICRYNGHSKYFYSVSEHSILVASLLESPTDKLAGLLHDASETYISDITRPVKGILADYKDIEHRIMDVIKKVFNIKDADWKLVKQADNMVLASEAKVLMKSKGKDWYLPDGCADVQLVCMNPEEAEKEFLARYCELL